MIILIAKILFVLSVLGILFMISRKIPVLVSLSEEPLVKRFYFKNIFKRFREFTDKIILSSFFQNILIGNLEKSLRRFKIMALKINNIIDGFLRKVKKNSGDINKPG